MSVAENLISTKQKIESTATQCERNINDIQLVAVSKKQPMDRIREALDTGHRLFGENRVQEAIEHWEDIRGTYPDLQLHLIGPLQTNKIRDAVRIFDVIETLDREKLARKLATEMEKQSKIVSCFIQVNTGDEKQKAGIKTSQLPEFLEFCTGECRINVIGLMCIPPFNEPPALHFALLSKLATQNGLTDLSMGMSSDFERAILLGATYVRIGTGVFGQRT